MSSYFHLWEIRKLRTKRCPGNCIRFCPIRKHPKNLVAQKRNHLFRLKLCGSSIWAGFTMAVLLLSAGLTHVTYRSTAEWVGSGWPRLASAMMAQYLLFMSVISRRLLGASHMVVVAGILEQEPNARFGPPTSFLIYCIGERKS